MTVFHRRYAPEATGRRSAAMMLNFRRTALAAALLASTFAPARGETGYPDRAVRVIVPFAPGGVVDVMARVLTKKVSGYFGKNLLLQNLGGACGDIGTHDGATAN